MHPFLRLLFSRFRQLAEAFEPPCLKEDPDSHRQARLQIRFGLLGALFGTAYSLFYLLVGHYWGVGIVMACSFVFAFVPFLQRHTTNLSLCGNVFAATLLLGFTGLCITEGGMNGHAIGWIASIPLCVLLLVELRPALIWTALCLVVAAAFGICDLLGIHFPETFDPKWHSLVHAAGYAGLVPFMGLLGLTFELTRSRAFDQLQSALDRLSQANEKLVQLNTEKNEFLGIAAHDLKNPLSIITGFGSILNSMDELDPADVKDYSGQIVKSADRMLDLITNLLDASAIDEGRVKLNCEPCDIATIVSEVERSNAQNATNKGIQMVYALESLGVLVDHSATYQILENLVSNAIKYSPHGSLVQVSTERDAEGNVTIGIIDQGPGLSEEDQAKLFQKFSRLTPKPTGGETSNGLGLWIVHRLAQSMGGNVWCRSKLGEGSTFGVTLPACELPDQEAPALAA